MSQAASHLEVMLQRMESATAAALGSAPWRQEKGMLVDRNGKPLLRHLFWGAPFSWSDDYEPDLAPAVMAYFVAANPAAMALLLQAVREALAERRAQADPARQDAADIGNASARERGRLYMQALTTWGADAQINQAMEEFGEATAALNRYRRGRTTDEDAAAELADAEIMLDQMRILFGPALVADAKLKKLHRLQQRLNAHANT